MTPARSLRRAGGIVCVFALVIARGADAQTRDSALASKLEPVGTGVISGTVITDETPPRALRRVIVTITEAANVILSRVVTTDEAGQFAFRNLPPGRYSVTASRPPFLAGAYGVRRIVGPGSVQTGTVIALANAQQMTAITVTLMRSSVITGVIRDVDGQPANGIRVSLSYFQYSTSTGERTLTPHGTGTTDDRGMYRIYGVPPGTYVVSAQASGSDAALTTDAEIQRAIEAIQRPGAGAYVATAQATRRPTVGYVPVFYPGVASALQATMVTLGVGEERSGVDFHLMMVPNARVHGTVTGPDGKPAAGVQLTGSAVTGGSAAAQMGVVMRTSSATNAEGQFTLTGLAPGTYTIEARQFPTGQEGATPLWASADVAVNAEETFVNLALQAGVVVSGRLVFESATTPAPADLSKATVSLTRAAGGAVAAGAAVKATGEFTFTNVAPWRYRLTASLVVPSIESGWYLKSATIHGQDAFDSAVELRPGVNVTGAVITMTDRPTEIIGTMTDASNSPAPEYFIIVFAADSTLWLPGTRRIMQTRPSSDGTFMFRNLPPGAYRIAAVTDIQQGEWFDPAFLAQLVDASVAVTLAEHGKVRQDLRIR